ncbi:MAG: FAD-dependent oxidoreductase [Bacilli bacterium]|nr:FAD-dependent oxidoreductase [Bacilli bacterium]
MFDIIIIGAGPAGMTAALYALRSNKNVLLLESKSYGGQIVNANIIENYPGIANISGFDFATNLFNQIKKLGVIYKNESVNRIENKFVITNNDKYYGKAIIVATGCDKKLLNIKDEEKYIGRGISYCATCDGNFYKNKVVAVVGGGNTALEDALYLSNIAKHVYLIHRRDIFRGENKYLDDIKKKNNIKIIYNATVKELIGDDYLNAIKISENDKVNQINIDGLFIAIGQQPNNECFKQTIDIDDYGYIISSDGVHTNCQNIYVAGDIRKKNLRQLTTATADGALAATIAIKEIEETD